jgi:regulator of Ty1 transposition protein 103
VEQVRSQLQAAQSRYKKAGELCRGLGIDVERHQPFNQGLKYSLSETPASIAPDSANTKSLQRGQSSAVLYSQEGNGAGHNAIAANVLTKLAVGAVSDKISDSALPSRANGGNTAVQIDEHSSGNKRQKQEDDTHISQPQSESPPPPPPPPPFPHPDAFQPPPPPEYPPSPEPSPPPPPTSTPPHIIPPPPPATMPPQMISPLPPTAGTFVPFPAGPPGPMYGTFPFTPVVNFPMNIPPGFHSPPTPPPAFQGLSGTFYGPPPFPTAPPPTDKK